MDGCSSLVWGVVPTTQLAMAFSLEGYLVLQLHLN